MEHQQVRYQFGPLESAVKRYDFSRFGNKFTQHSGITQLMDDMNEGLHTPDAIMLGGGNPAAIPVMEQYFHLLWREMLDFDWPIMAANIALTNGNQRAFFYLFNLGAGRVDEAIACIRRWLPAGTLPDP